MIDNIGCKLVFIQITSFDILEIKVSDVRNKTHIAIKEKKTDKFKKAYINSSLRT